MSEVKANQNTKMLKRAQKAITNNEFYEAQQLYTTLSGRFCAQKQVDLAIKYLSEGAIKLLLNHETNSGGSLALLLAETLLKYNIEINSFYITMIKELFMSFPSMKSDDKSNRIQTLFMRKAIKWSITTEFKRGNPSLHLLLARYYANLSEYALAHRHYIHSENCEEDAEILLEWSKIGNHSEKDLFITRALLQYLILGSLSLSREFFEIALPKFDLDVPLINFCRFLIQSLHLQSISIFNMLKDIYQISLSRDPAFLEYIERIGQIYFNLPPSSGGNLVDDLLQFLNEDTSS